MPSCSSRLRWLFLAGCVVGVSACGSAQPKGSLSGTVTYKGNPIKQGQLQIFSQEVGIGAVAPIADGKFALEEPVPVGTYQAAVAPLFAPPDPTQPSTAQNRPLDIPLKAQNEKTSGLSVTIKEGANQAELALQD